MSKISGDVKHTKLSAFCHLTQLGVYGERGNRRDRTRGKKHAENMKWEIDCREME